MAFDFHQQAPAAGAATFQGTAANSPDKDRGLRLRMKPSPRFYYMHHPSSGGWECVDTEAGWRWLPRLTEFRLIPGVNGIRQTRNGGVDDRGARVTRMDQGYQFIPYDVIEGGYCIRYQGSRGAVHLPRWCAPRQVGMDIVTEIDVEGWAAFRAMLVEEGHIQAPDYRMLEIIIHRQEAQVESASQNLHNPAVKARHEAMSELVEGMKAALKVHLPKPKTKRRKRKALPAPEASPDE